MKYRKMQTAVYVFAVLVFAMASLWIGKTTIDTNHGFHMKIDRPVTAVFFFLAMVSSLFNI